VCSLADVMALNDIIDQATGRQSKASSRAGKYGSTSARYVRWRVASGSKNKIASLPPPFFFFIFFLKPHVPRGLSPDVSLDS
jgi:hypothetical protein